jgi:hypothetical protein
MAEDVRRKELVRRLADLKRETAAVADELARHDQATAAAAPPAAARPDGPVEPVSVKEIPGRWSRDDEPGMWLPAGPSWR